MNSIIYIIYKLWTLHKFSTNLVNWSWGVNSCCWFCCGFCWPPKSFCCWKSNISVGSWACCWTPELMYWRGFWSLCCGGDLIIGAPLWGFPWLGFCDQYLGVTVEYICCCGWLAISLCWGCSACLCWTICCLCCWNHCCCCVLQEKETASPKNWAGDPETQETEGNWFVLHQW